MHNMYLGIEIGGTKLQLGVGHGDGSPMAALERVDVEPSRGAEYIRRQIEEHAATLISQHDVTAVGIGFGGPVDAAAGRTIVSHQVEGWGDFALADWCRDVLGRPAVLGNDSDLAGLAEARFGAGRGHAIVFYTNIGSGIGGALILDGKLYRGAGGVASELGHLRPGLQSDHPDQTLESIASGWAIADAVRSRLADPSSHPLAMLTGEGVHPWQHEEVRQHLIQREEADEEAAADLLQRCDGDGSRLTTAMITQAAAEGNRLAEDVFAHAVEAFGWGIAQMITLLAPQVVVVGGGVSLVGERRLFVPLRKQVNRYVFPPLRDSFQIVAAELGEETVVHGALALAAERATT